MSSSTDQQTASHNETQGHVVATTNKANSIRTIRSGDISDSAPKNPSHQLHDLLSLGEIESALSSSTNSPSDTDEKSSSGTQLSNDASLGLRLPLLLRWLSVAQPLADISPNLDAPKENKNSSKARPDPDVIVPLLEDVAASHPDAENVEVLVSALAPSVCRDTIAKLPLLTRNAVESLSHNSWNIINLDAALERLSNQSQHQSSKRQLDQDQSRAGKRQKIHLSDAYNNKDGIEAASSDDDEDKDVESSTKSYHRQNSETQEDISNFFTRASSAANDSHESAMRKALHELVGLVASSLRTHSNSVNNADNDGGGEESGNGRENRDGDETPSSSGRTNLFLKETGFLTPGISVKSDSLFAETNATSASIGGGWSGLTVMVPALMHHAPMLRHEHVANALCRSAVPQAPNLILHMAANCPAASLCLIRGCITAYQLGEKFKHFQTEADGNILSEDVDNHHSNPTGPEVSDIISTSIESLRRLASLSRREAFNVIRMLKEQRAMDELVLSLLIEHDPIGAASFIVENLSTSSGNSTNFRQNQSEPSRDTNIPEEDVNTDGRGLCRRRLRHRSRIPLHQRMINCHPRKDATKSIIEASSTQQQNTSQLFQALVETKSLAENARRCISRSIIFLLDSKEHGAHDENKQNVSLGEASLLIQAYSLLVYRVGIGAGSSAGSGSKFVEDTMNSIRNLSDHTAVKKNGLDLPSDSASDNVYEIALCATIITCSKFPPIGDTSGSFMGGSAVRACFECFQSLFSHPVSITSVVFSARLAGFVIEKDASNLRTVVLRNVNNHTFWAEGSSSESEELLQMSNVCRWLSTKLDHDNLKRVQNEGMSIDVILHDPSAVIDALRRSESQSSNELDDLIKKVLVEPSMCLKMIQHSSICKLLQESVNMLMRRPPPYIPLVLPLSLERLAQSIPWEKIKANECTREILCQFVLQLLYALKFLDVESTSPFAINPLSFPLKEALSFLEYCQNNLHCGRNTGFLSLQVSLKESISKHGPGILHALSRNSWLRPLHVGSVARYKCVVSPKMVCDAIKDCLLSEHSMENSDIRAEEMFLLCRSVYPWSDLDAAVVGAMFATNHSHPKFYSYTALCKDPLVLLKARAAIWKCRGTRRIMLWILKNLMEANESIAMNSSTTEQVGLEFLASRDAIIVQCILFACQHGFVFDSSGTDKSPPTHCVMSVNMIRSIISMRRGVVATLIKQGLTDGSVDWLVEFIPESFLDAPILLNMLSEKGLLTPAERLTSASAALRIAVANSPRGEEMARQLVSASLETLVESFYLVVGPVGVPVSFLREDDGRDIAYICRKAMFRMLNTLSSISAKNAALKNDAQIAINKICTFCKNENAGALASRRKALLKEIWDACDQATTSLGGRTGGV